MILMFPLLQHFNPDEHHSIWHTHFKVNNQKEGYTKNKKGILHLSFANSINITDTTILLPLFRLGLRGSLLELLGPLVTALTA